MRVLMLTQWFEPEPTFKGVSFARALMEQGHEVEVVTGFPNYPEGRVYPGYRIQLTHREVIEGIRVLRVALYPSHDANAIRRVANYVSFGASAAVFGTLLTRRADVIYAYHHPPTTGLAAAVVGAVHGTPFLLDIQDLWPDTLAATGMIRDRRVLWFVDQLNRWVYRRAAALVVNSPGFKAALVERGVPEHKIEVIRNWSPEDQLRMPEGSETEAATRLEDRFTVMFAGTAGKAQGLGAVLDAAKLLQETNPEVRFVLIGGGVEAGALEERAKNAALDNVRFLPRLPVAEIGLELAGADVLLVHLRDDPLFEITIPGKTQAYLSVGKPVLMAMRGDAARLIDESGGGVVCRPDDPEDLARAVRELARMEPAALAAMGARGQAFYRSNLSLEIGMRSFSKVFERVRRSRRPSSPR